jgi:hypothetical protein
MVVAARFAAGSFVWAKFPSGPPHRPDVPGPVRHIAYVLGWRGEGAAMHMLLAYTSSGPWRGASPHPPRGVIEFDEAAARPLQQRAFHIDLRCLARVPVTEAWFPDLGLPERGVVAIAGPHLQERILTVAGQLATRSPHSIEMRGL